MDRRQSVVDAAGDDEMLFADGYDEAILGFSQRCGEPAVVVYDRQKVISCLVKDGLSEDEAEEFFEFNVVGAWVGPRTPVFLIRLEED